MTRTRWSGALLLGIALAASGCGYNRLQSLDEQVNQAQGQIEVQLQRRADLIPNLVETVKGVTKQESTVFTAVADARARLSGAISQKDVPAMATANAELTQGLGRLLAIVENYPELKSSESFRTLQDQLEGTENRVAVARADYNRSVGEFNTLIRKFPENLTAKMFGLSTPRDYFEAEETAKDAPQVRF